MNKDALIKEVASRLEVTQKEATPFVDEVFAVITDTLAEGEPVDLYGFGKFSVAERAARKGRNPSTGEEILISASRTPKFKPLKNLKDAVK